jgi:two-component system, NarL family, nitrate/nitrite response regulator NarL
MEAASSATTPALSVGPVCTFASRRKREAMTTVLIIASIRIYREGLALILAPHPSLRIAALASGREPAREYLTHARADVVLLDLMTPDSAAIVRDVEQLQSPAPPVVALGMLETEQEMLSCIESGIAGLVSRDASIDELVTTLESAARGELKCSPHFAAALMRRVATLTAARESRRSPDRLTARECEIVRLLEDNLSNKEIAARLGIEVTTVKNHVHNLLEKLQVHRRSDVTRRLARATPPLPGPIGPGNRI